MTAHTLGTSLAQAEIHATCTPNTTQQDKCGVPGLFFRLENCVFVSKLKFTLRITGTGKASEVLVEAYVLYAHVFYTCMCFIRAYVLYAHACRKTRMEKQYKKGKEKNKE